MAYQNPQNPDALPWFAEPEKKGAQASPSQTSPPPQQQNFRPPQQQYSQPPPQQQHQQYGQPSPQQQHYPQQQQQQHYQQPPQQQQQQYHQPPQQQQNYQRSHSPAVPPRDPYNNGGGGGGNRVGLPTGPRPGTGNAPPPRSPVPPQLRSPPPHQQQHPQHPQQPPQSPAAPKLVYQGEEELTTEQLRDIFNGLDTSRLGVITEKQLAQNLVNSDRTKFDAYTVNMMVRMFDSDRSGDLNFSEFVGLWQFLDRWRTIFNRFDTDRSGNINMAEFKNTLVSFSYRLSDSFIEFLFRNYDRENKGVITFDLFMQSCITLKRMTDTFKKYDDDRDGFITINFEDFVSEFLRQMKRVMFVDDSKSAPSGGFY